VIVVVWVVLGWLVAAVVFTGVWALAYHLFGERPVGTLEDEREARYEDLLEGREAGWLTPAEFGELVDRSTW
jgi:hypothetical protein